MAIEIHEQRDIATFYLNDRDKRILQVEPWGTRRRRYSAQSWLNEASARKALSDGLVEWEEWTFGGMQMGERPVSTSVSLAAQRRATGAGLSGSHGPLVHHKPITVSPKPVAG